MNIVKEINDKTLILYVEGELNSSTAPVFESELTDSLKGIKTLILDFEKLNYLSSAGLRVILVAQKVMQKQGKMIVRHVNEAVNDIFTITGFNNILDIED